MGACDSELGTVIVMDFLLSLLMALRHYSNMAC